MKVKFNDFFLLDDDENINFYNEDIISEFDKVENIIVYENVNYALEYVNSRKDNDSIPGNWLIDINMPVMNGFEFLDNAIVALKTLEILPNIYILSSSSHKVDEEQFRKRSFINGFISKPLLELKLAKILAD